MNWQTLSLGLHLGALALWIGGVIFFLVVFGPALKGLEPGVAMRILNHGRRSLEAVAWTGISLLLLSGIVNLILRRPASVSSLGQFYLVALSIKLIVFGAMVYHHGLQVFKYGAQIAAMTAETAPDTGSWPENLRILWQRWFTLLKINATLGPIATLMGVVLLKS
jgi:cytochrome b subunit of formate dehydrogenase